MFSTILRYWLIIQYVFFSFIARSCGVSYRVRRLNDSTYLVTNYQDFSYENLYDFKRVFEETTNKPNIFLTTGLIEDIHEKFKQIPASVIKEARENYFKNVYQSMKKNHSKAPNKTFNLANIRDNNIVSNISDKLDDNLQKARKLAMVLNNELHYSITINSTEIRAGLRFPEA